MGQNNNGQTATTNQYLLVQDLPNGSIVRETNSGRLHFLKEYSFTNQQAYQQAFVNFSKKLPQKHQHILYLQRTNTKLQNTFCSTFYKISLLYQYLDHTLQKEILQRIQEKKIFDQKQVWSILCSCTLAVNEMIRLEGRCHSAINTKDIRLTAQGVVKILSLQMIGMQSNHNINQQGSPKQLAMTILNCLLMDQIANDSLEYLHDLVDGLDSTQEMKNILRLMLNANIKFIDVEQYLFKLVREETDSLNSYSNTPVVKQKNVKQKNSYSRIPQESKEDDNLLAMIIDSEEIFQSLVPEPHTQEVQCPDENDLMDEQRSKATDSNRNTLRQKNESYSSHKIKYQSPNQNQNTSKKNQNNAESSLFTDPKLLQLIHTDLQDIKKRKSVTNSRKLGPSDSTVNIQKTDSRQVSVSNLQNSITNKVVNGILSFQALNKKDTVPQYVNMNTIKEIVESNASSNVKINGKKQSERSFEKEEQVKSTNYIPNKKQERDQNPPIGWKSQKEIIEYKSNPEDKKIPQKKYQNIMENEQMGFKKTKIVSKREQTKQQAKISNNPSNSNVNTIYNPVNSNVNTIVYNSGASSYNSNTFPLTNISNNERKYKNMIMEEPKKELQYVSEIYIKGRYQGTKLKNMRHGKGVFYYNEGGKYVGEWKENKMNGRGILYYPSNSIAYDGQWQADQLWGKGILYNEGVSQLRTPFDYKNFEKVDDFWVKYQGQFSNDSKNGDGKLYLSNGQIFEGKFKDDTVWGEGVLLRRDGNKVRGVWRENQLIKLL